MKKETPQRKRCGILCVFSCARSHRVVHSIERTETIEISACFKEKREERYEIQDKVNSRKKIKSQ